MRVIFGTTTTNIILERTLPAIPREDDTVVINGDAWRVVLLEWHFIDTSGGRTGDHVYIEVAPCE